MTLTQYRLCLLGMAAIGVSVIVTAYLIDQKRTNAKWDEAREKMVDVLTPPTPDDFREVNG